MILDEVNGDDRKRRRRKRRYYDAPQYEEPDTATLLQQPHVSAYQPPPDPATLREARLKAMDTPAAARQKMKHESQFIRPAKVTAAVKPKKVKTSPTPRPRTSIFSVKPRTASVKVPKKDNHEEGYQSVYQAANPSMVDRRDFQKEHDARPKAPKTTKTAKTTPLKRKSTSATAEKPKLERRKTEPTLRRSSTAATVRPQTKKSTTSTRLEGVKELEEDAGKDAKSDTVVSNVKSSKPQRNSSVFGSLFVRPPEKQVSCLICGSDTIPISQSAKLPCSHRMCHACLKRLFRLSVKDPAHMPPKCCNDNEIDLKHVDALFDNDFKKTWNRKLKEYSTKNKIYCPRKGCGEWIQPKHMRFDDNRRKIGVCPKCSYKTCVTCNQRAHRSRECPKDPAMKQFAEAAEQAGWRKCYNCSAMVELKEGCNHMTCRCTAEFCMVCGLKWKSCDCPWFNYNAVDDLRGDPVRQQQEMDRRQQQMREDERVARRMAGLDLGDGDRNRNRDQRRDVDQFQVENLDLDEVHANFLQQARATLTANYQNAEITARGLLGGWLAGRQHNLPAELVEDLDQNLHQPPGAFPVTPPRRRTHRTRRSGGDRQG